MTGGARVFVVASIATVSLFATACAASGERTADGSRDAANGRSRGPVTSLPLADAYRKQLAPGEDAWDMALTTDGSALVALRAPGKIMKVGPDGSVKEWASGLFSPDRITVLADGTVAVREGDSVVRVAGR